jgi:hypothetical protein
LETELKLDPDSNPDPELITDPDTNLKIVSDPVGSGCTSLQKTTSIAKRMKFVVQRMKLMAQ